MPNLYEILADAQGGEAITALGREFGLTSQQTEAAVAALLPAISMGLKQSTATPEGLGDLFSVMGRRPDLYAMYDDPGCLRAGGPRRRQRGPIHDVRLARREPRHRRSGTALFRRHFCGAEETAAGARRDSHLRLDGRAAPDRPPRPLRRPRRGRAVASATFWGRFSDARLPVRRARRRRLHHPARRPQPPRDRAVGSATSSGRFSDARHRGPPVRRRAPASSRPGSDGEPREVISSARFCASSRRGSARGASSRSSSAAGDRSRFPCRDSRAQRLGHRISRNFPAGTSSAKSCVTCSAALPAASQDKDRRST